MKIFETYCDALMDLKDHRKLERAFKELQRRGGYFARPEIGEIRTAYREAGGEVDDFGARDRLEWKPSGCEFCKGEWQEYVITATGERCPIDAPAFKIDAMDRAGEGKSVERCRNYEEHRAERERIFGPE